MLRSFDNFTSTYRMFGR